MTKQEAITNHRKMWRWIADETERRGSVATPAHYFDTMGIPGEDRPYQLSYCCDYGLRSGGAWNCCASCPIEWPGGASGSHLFNCGNGGLRSQFIDVSLRNDWIAAAALAHKIAELPESEKTV